MERVGHDWATELNWMRHMSEDISRFQSPGIKSHPDSEVSLMTSEEVPEILEQKKVVLIVSVWFLIPRICQHNTLKIFLKTSREVLSLQQNWEKGKEISHIFTALKICYDLPTHSCLLPHNTQLLTITFYLTFPGCYRAGIIQCLASSGWLLSLTNMHLTFLYVFSWLHSSFLCSAG